VEKQEIAQAIHKAITEKGWNLYCRGAPKKKWSLVKTFRKGPVDLLEPGMLYVIFPRVDNPTDQREIDAFIEKHQVQPKITVSYGFLYPGRCVAQFSGKDKTEYLLHPGEEICFIGIELLEKEVWLLASIKTFMPYNAFLRSLNSLQDITELEKVPV